MRFGLVVFGSIRNARVPLTRNSSAWPSSVPRKLAAVVPLLPLRPQPALVTTVPGAAETVMASPAVWTVTFVPGSRRTESCRPLSERTTWPEAMPGPVTAPAATALAVAAVPAPGAYSAYGVGVSGWRGLSVVKSSGLPLVRTPISSQCASPMKIPESKSRVRVKRPLLTAVAVLVSALPTWVPFPAAS